MARIRYLKPEFFFDDDLAQLDFASRLFFQGLWCYADREGRLEDKPKVLKAQIMPYDKFDTERTLEKLNGGFVTRYEIEGRRYIQINNFLKHQKPHHTEKASVIPPSNNGVITVKEPSLNVLKDKDKDKDKEKLKNKRKGSDKECGFVLFWKEYPKKKSIGQAEKAWEKIKPDNGLLEIILGKLREAKESMEWKKDNGLYIPHPATWLNAKGWEDEYIRQKTVTDFLED